MDKLTPHLLLMELLNSQIFLISQIPPFLLGPMVEYYLYLPLIMIYLFYINYYRMENWIVPLELMVRN